MYELFILGELLNQPMHGYKLNQVIKEAIGPLRQLNWGSLYPLLRSLEHAGMIVREIDSTSTSRERKLYRITPLGKERFYALMVAPGVYSTDYPDLFTIKMSKFQHITLAQRLAILRHYRGFVEYIHGYLLDSQQHIVSEPNIPAAEQPYILRGLDHRLHITQADLVWLDAEIARLESDGDESHR